MATASCCSLRLKSHVHSLALSPWWHLEISVTYVTRVKGHYFSPRVYVRINKVTAADQPFHLAPVSGQAPLHSPWSWSGTGVGPRTGGLGQPMEV